MLLKCVERRTSREEQKIRRFQFLHKQAIEDCQILETRLQQQQKNNLGLFDEGIVMEQENKRLSTKVDELQDQAREVDTLRNALAQKNQQIHELE